MNKRGLMRDRLWDTSAQLNKPMPLPPMSPHLRAAVAPGPPAPVRRDAGEMETKAKAQAKART
eukprot:3986768-Pyramimonas_sp.AAC.1